MKVFVVYEDVTFAGRACAALRQAASRAKVHAKCDIRPWRVDILRLALAADEAMVEAVDADLVVLAGLRASSLPAWLKEWLECWGICRQTADPALLVISDKASGKHSGGITRELLRFAARNDVDFKHLTAATFATAWRRMREIAPGVRSFAPSENVSAPRQRIGANSSHPSARVAVN